MQTENLIRQLQKNIPVLWTNPHFHDVDSTDSVTAELSGLRLEAIARWQWLESFIKERFPELQSTAGILDAPLIELPDQYQPLGAHPETGRYLIQADHQFPIAGSVKARGGFYEILLFAESLARQHELLTELSSSTALGSDEARALFSQYRIGVGSTGNLGMAIGLMSAALGFQAEVHMSVEAKEWKKQRLRQHGVKVVEHSGDYAKAVEAGRQQAELDEKAYFVDDERSKALFVGYSTAATCVQQKLAMQNIEVNAEHPLLVYIPCGVGGAPGGIAFGLRQLFAPHVHIFFVEPCASPCVLANLASSALANEDPARDEVSVYDWGLNNQTIADGLAVPTASGFVCSVMQQKLSGVITASDEEMLDRLRQLYKQTGIKIEPSAAAALLGPERLLNTTEGQTYLQRQNINLSKATHILWTTGGSLVPEEIFSSWLE